MRSNDVAEVIIAELDTLKMGIHPEPTKKRNYIAEVVIGVFCFLKKVLLLKCFL